MADKIKLRRDTLANWEAVNPILDEGEIGVILDLNDTVIGDGVTEFTKLLPQGVLSEFITVTVGPTGDFKTPQEALTFLVHTYRAFSPYYEPYDPTIDARKTPALIMVFKNDYVFDVPFVIRKLNLPNLYIYQEDNSIPLEANLNKIETSYLESIIIIEQSNIGSINLNLNYTGIVPSTEKLIGLLLSFSNVFNVQFRISNVNNGLEVADSSHIAYLTNFVANNISHYALYAKYGSFIHVKASDPSIPLSFTNIGTTHPGYGNAIATNTAFIKIYDFTTINIDNVKRGFATIREGNIEIHGGCTVNINNCEYGLHNGDYGNFYIHEPIHFGPNVQNQVYPTSFAPNTFNPNGVLYAPNGIAAA